MAIDILKSSNENTTSDGTEQWDDQSWSYWGCGADDDTEATLKELADKTRKRSEIRLTSALAFFCYGCGRKLNAWIHTDADSFGKGFNNLQEATFPVLVEPCPSCFNNHD